MVILLASKCSSYQVSSQFYRSIGRGRVLKEKLKSRGSESASEVIAHVLQFLTHLTPSLASRCASAGARAAAATALAGSGWLARRLSSVMWSSLMLGTNNSLGGWAVETRRGLDETRQPPFFIAQGLLALTSRSGSGALPLPGSGRYDGQTSEIERGERKGRRDRKPEGVLLLLLLPVRSFCRRLATKKKIGSVVD